MLRQAFEDETRNRTPHVAAAVVLKFSPSPPLENSAARRAQVRHASADGLGRRRRQGASVGKISAKCSSFSAVSAPIFARKYAFCSIFQDLPDSQAEIFEI